MHKSEEPGGFADPREPDMAYKAAIIAAGFTITPITFGFFHAMTELPRHAEIPVGDIAWPGHVVIEVKTKGDLASSMASGRLGWAIWHMYLLKLAGRVNGFAVLVRGVSDPLDPNAAASYIIALQALARWSPRFGFTVLIAEDPDSVIAVAKSFMREFWDPHPVAMPGPMIPKELLEWDFGMQVICCIPGWYTERAKALLSRRPFWGIVIDAHEMADDAFCDAYCEVYGFGGKETKLLHALWAAFNKIELFKETDIVNIFQMKPISELIQA